jgi:hypothetical protein
MVEDITEDKIYQINAAEECLFSNMVTGMAIVDSGASRTIVGEDVWKQWLEHMRERDVKEIHYNKEVRDFRFGDGNVVRSNYEVNFPAYVKGQKLSLTAAVVPGGTPFLVARPTLEEWKVKQDYENARLKVMNSDWFEPERDKKKHYILNLMDYEDIKEEVNHQLEENNKIGLLTEECEIVFKDALENDMDAIMVAEDVQDSWTIEPNIDKEGMVETSPNCAVDVDVNDALELSEVAVGKSFASRGLLFWEVYVDPGNISQHMVNHYPDVEVANFSLPDWDFKKAEIRKRFLELMDMEKPHFIWLAPPCTLWSPMQNLNAITEADKQRLQELRDEEESAHLQLCKDVHDKSYDIYAGDGIENPDRARSWFTPTWQSMEEYYDVVCDRCRTGLAYYKNGIFQGLVKKSTRIRTNSPELAEALDLKCQCPQGEHVQMIGKSAALKDMQNYEPNFVQRAAKAIYNNMENNWRLRQIAQVMVTEELNDEEAEKERKAAQQQHRLTEHDRQLSKEFGPASLNVVKKLHRQLGHPGNDRLVKALKDANFDETIIKCGRQFRCDICESFAPKKLDRPASLPQTTHFNDMLEMDVFHIKWHGQKHKILAVLDLHTRYEMNEVVNSESFDEETAALERWMSWAGVPRRIKTDSSGAHMGEEMQSWCDEYGIKLILVPKDAHNRMGTIERLHAVRRRQLMKMMKENTSLDIRKAVIIACSQRNRLRSIHGISPAAMVLGYTPEDDGICNEPTRLRVDGRQAYMEDQAIRALATKAFYEANTDATLRQAMLAKTRTDDEPLQVGDYGYYWRMMMDKEASRWRGPALVCAVESRPDGRPDVYWMAHGSSLVRVAQVMARREVPAERTARLEQLPDTAAREPAQQRVLRALRPVRGPIRFLDLAPDGSSVDTEANAAQSAATMEAKAAQRAATVEIKNEDADSKSSIKEETKIKEEIKMVKRDSAAAELETNNNMDIEQQPAAEVTAEKRERSRSPPKEDEARLRMSQASFDAARRLEGLPPRAATRQELNSNWHGPVDNIDVDDELLAEEFNEKRLSLEERAQFDEAKDQALRVWIENEAWRPVNVEEADPEETVPARVLQRWKPKPDAPGGRVANARVILQGFKHRDVLTQEIEKEAPTLSRIGKHLIYLFALQRRWKIFAADVKSAFMQADSIDQDTRIYIKPSSDMRRRLERLMGLKHYELLKATKPAFGDVRAPRQWNASADGVMINNMRFLRHPLDRCVYLSIREANQDDEEFACFNLGGSVCTVDGVMGLHVDDYLGAGEGINSPHDLEGDYDGNFNCFRDRLCGLSKRFKFGSWDFGPTIRFCGASVEQSLNNDCISISMKEYVKKVHPLTVEKTRKTMVNDPCDEKEQRGLRALVGALAWPANQGLPQLSASVSILQASTSKPQVKDLLEANKALRFAKNVSQDYKMKLYQHSERLEDVKFSVYTDAAWSVRPDGSSQGGFLIFAASESELRSGAPFNMTIIDWHSKKLVRMCRSSLSAEAQASAAAVDELEWCKVFWSTMVNPTLSIETDETLCHSGLSYVLTDAKSLFDASKSITSGMHLTERRTAIEVAIVAERVKVMQAEWKWLNSHQQVADGLTKPSAKDRFAEILQRGNHQLKFDPNFVAAKKVAQKDKDAQERHLQQVATEQVFGLTDFEDENKSADLCQLRGCKKKIDSSEPHHKFCSRRHFYLSHHRKFGWSDEWSKSAKLAISILAVENASQAEAHMFGDDVLKANTWWNVFTAFAVIFFFAQVFFKFIHVIERIFEYVRLQLNVPASENIADFENDITFETKAVQANVRLHAYDMALEEIFLFEENYARPSHGVPIPDEGLWRTTYDEVLNEPDQEMWRKLSSSILAGKFGHRARDWWYANTASDVRAERFLQRDHSGQPVSESKMKTWHRLCNFSDGKFLRGFLTGFAEHLRETQEDQQREVAERIMQGKLHDKIIQTRCTWKSVHHGFSVLAGENSWGAWNHRSALDERD